MFSHIVIILFLVCTPYKSLERIWLDLLLPVCFPTALVRLPTSAQPLHLATTRYAFEETPAHLLNNRTKSVKDSNNRFWFKRTDLALQKANIKRPCSIVSFCKDKHFLRVLPIYRLWNINFRTIRNKSAKETRKKVMSKMSNKRIRIVVT